ncbi:hypothetical protein BSNK01_21300 [Bacillaceae bacterium]
MVKLYRSLYDKKLTGLCGGLAQMLDVDSTIVRVLLVIFAVFSGGTVILIYLLASLVVPKEPFPHDPYGYADSRLHVGANLFASKITEESSPLDAMMESIEKKALLKELEELRAKVAKYEKHEKGDV